LIGSNPVPSVARGAAQRKILSTQALADNLQKERGNQELNAERLTLWEARGAVCGHFSFGRFKTFFRQENFAVANMDPAFPNCIVTPRSIIGY
jgi:hypothetical protein